MKKLLVFLILSFCCMSLISAAYNLEEKPELKKIDSIVKVKLGYGFYESFCYNPSNERIERVFVLDSVPPLIMSYVLIVDKTKSDVVYDGFELGIEYKQALIDVDVQRTLLNKFYEEIKKGK